LTGQGGRGILLEIEKKTSRVSPPNVEFVGRADPKPCPARRALSAFLFFLAAWERRTGNLGVDYEWPEGAGEGLQPPIGA